MEHSAIPPQRDTKIHVMHLGVIRIILRGSGEKSMHRWVADIAMCMLLAHREQHAQGKKKKVCTGGSRTL